MSLPPQLGARLDTHRPLALGVALAVSATPGLVIAAGMLWSTHLPWWSAPLALVGTTLLVIALLSEWLFVEHRLHEHGLVLDSAVPGTPSYVLPYAAVDAASVRPQERQAVPEADRLDVAKNRKLRQSPGCDSVLFVSLTPTQARRLNKLRGDSQAQEWDTLVAGFARLPSTSARLRAGEEWVVGFRNNAAAAERLAAAAARAQRVDR